MNENGFFSIRISLRFVPKGPIYNKAALVHVMAGVDKRQAITWTKADPVHRRIYAIPGGDKLRYILLLILLNTSPTIKLWICSFLFDKKS